MSAWEAFFGWPLGGVWSNLLAAALWVPIAAVATAVVTAWRVRVHLNRHLAPLCRDVERIHTHLGIGRDMGGQEGGAP